MLSKDADTVRNEACSGKLPYGGELQYIIDTESR